jgi:hypothetical protein
VPLPTRRLDDTRRTTWQVDVWELIGDAHDLAPRPRRPPLPPSTRRRRWHPTRAVVALGLAVFAVALGLLGIQDLRGRAELRTVTAQIDAAHGRAAVLADQLRSVRGTLAATENQRGAFQQYYQEDLQRITVLQQDLAIDATNLSVNNTHITALQNCLSSVQRALDQVSVGVSASATDLLTTASAACSIAQAGAPDA